MVIQWIGWGQSECDDQEYELEITTIQWYNTDIPAKSVIQP